MATQVLPENNLYTGSGADEFANSTSADESFTMGAGSNVINFDLSNNNVLGTDEIHLTPGEDLILNFTGTQYYSYFNTSLISWEKVVNNDGTIDIVVHTSPYYTLGYVKVETEVFNEIVYQSSYSTEYKAVNKIYVYDYNHGENEPEWVLTRTYDTYSYSNPGSTYTTFGLQYMNQAGQPTNWYNSYSDQSYDRHEERYNDGYIGRVTDRIDSDSVLNTIVIKDIGAENTANSVKIQYSNPNDGGVYTCYEYVDGSRQDINFITRKYDIGNKNEITNEDQVLQGSFLNEVFYAGFGDDTINTVGGDNEVKLANGGNDVITLGAGADLINAEFGGGYQCQLNTNNVSDGVYIKNGTSADTLLLYNDGTNNFYRDGNNLVIIQNWQYNVDSGSGARARNSKFTIEDYFTAESKIVIKSGHISGSYNYEHYYTWDGENTITESYVQNNEDKTYDRTIGSIIQNSGEIEGTASSEAIVATGLANITTGAGDDTIYTSEENDTITINGAGDKHIVIDENSGDDTIIIQNHEGNIYLDLVNYSGYNFFKSKEVTNDLIIERYRKEYTGNGYVNKFTGRTVIKNYFTFSDEEKAKIFAKRAYNWGVEYDQVSVSELNIEGDEGEANTIYGSDLKDTITGKELVDSITTGKGDDLITPNQGDDIININDSGAKTIYLGKGDGNDTINITNNFQNSYLYLSYTDAYAGLSYQIDDDNNLITYRTYVDGDDILTEGVTVTGITGEGDVTAANIANYNGDLNASGKIYFYRKEAGSVYEQGTSIGGFAANTPWLIQGSPTEGNPINTSDDGNVSHLITGGSGKDNITSSGEIEHIYTGAEDDTISVNSTISTSSSVNSLVYSGSGNDQITVNGTDVSKTYVYAEDGSDIINVASGKVYVYAGDGNDAVNVSGGSTEIYPGAGEDTINITGGTGGLIIIKRGEGNKTINFDGASGTRYSFRFDNYSNVIYYKREKNLIAEGKYTRYYYDENGNYQEETITETHTMNNFFDPNHSKVDSDTAINGNIKYVRLNNEGIFDTELNATVFEGTACEDFINGTDGVDIITTGSADDNITPGKGDDLITINGAGYKDFYYTKGDGNDVITIADDVVFYNGYESSHESADKIYFGDKTYYGQYYERPERWAYSINDDDLILHRIYSNNGDALTETTTIKGIKGVNDDNTEVNAQNIASWDGGLNISGHLYIQNVGNINNLSQINIGKENESNNITTTAGVKNTAIGGNESDIITSGGTDDYIVAGAGNDSIVTTASTVTIYGGEGNDNITSSANVATIYDGIGDDNITVTQGTNNIYLGAGSDTVRVSGGKGTIYLAQGSGHNTLIFENNNDNGTCDLAGNYNISGGGSYDLYYEKSGDDLVIHRYDSGADSLTIKGLFGDNQLSDGSRLTISGSTLSSMTIAGNYDRNKKATVFSGSNYGDNIYGTNGKDIITTGGGDDVIYTRKGNDTVIIDGSGNKTIYFEKGGNKVIQLGEGVELGTLRLDRYDGNPYVSSYRIENNDFVQYRTYVDGDKFTTESIRFTGITGGDVTYDNIMGYGDTQLNLTNKLNSRPYLQLTQGNFKKSNKIKTKEGTNNLVLGGKKKDTITLNGMEDKTYTGAGADKITVNGNYGSGEVHAGSGNDTIILNAREKGVDIYGGKGNDKIYANGNSSYNIYGEKGDGNDTIILGKDFNKPMYFYNTGNSSPTQQAYKIVNNNLILYRTYVDGDNITTNSVKITGIKSKTGNPVEVNYNNISSNYGGLNISGSYISDFNKNMVQGKAGKANKLTSKAGEYNVITGGKKKDTVTLNGYYDYAYTGKGNDNITVNNTGGGYVYAGSGNDTINVKGGNSNVIYTGKGKDKINISGGSGTIYLNAGEGNDTITFNGEDFGSYIIRFEGSSGLYYNSYNNYYKNGNDLLIKCTYRDSKGKTKTETHTIKDYFANEAVLKDKLTFRYDSASYCLNNYGINIIGKYNKKQKATIFEGTDYRDTITGTSKKDIIYTGNGNDKITAGKGNDEIIINGPQIELKYVYLNNGDGNDIIKWEDDAEGIADLVINRNDVLSYEKSDRDLIITRSYQSGNSIKSEKTTVKDYYDENGNPVTYNIYDNEYTKILINDSVINTDASFNRVNYTTSTFDVENNYEFATGTKNGDKVTITADNSSVFTLAGNDIINVNSGENSNSYVAGGAGNDTINLNTTGKVYVQHQSGDGNDIINFGENIPTKLNIKLESPAFDNSDGKVSNRLDALALSGKLGFKKSGNNLVITVPKTSKSNTKTETVTIANYFNNEAIDPSKISVSLNGLNYSSFPLLSSAFDTYGIWTEGTVTNGVTTYTGLDGYKNHYEYKGTGKTIINGSDEQDYYLVNINSKSNLYINDAGCSGYSGDGDTMCINTNYKNLRALFNMSADGKVIVSSEDIYSDNFMLFNKGSLTYDNIKNIFSGKDGKGVINIDNFFGETTNYSPNGVGAIESIYAQKNIVNKIVDGGLSTYNYDIQPLHPSLWVEDLGRDVANWLAANTDGSRTSFEIFESGSKAEITALLKVYNTAYDRSFTT